jgi:hypothetical protein
MCFKEEEIFGGGGMCIIKYVCVSVCTCMHEKDRENERQYGEGKCKTLCADEHATLMA